MKYAKLAIIGSVIFGELLLLVFLMPGIVVWLGLIIGGLTALFFLFMARRAQRSRSGESTRTVNILPILSGILPIFFGWMTMQMGNFSPVVAILTTALTFDFFSNFLALPLSLYHKYLEDKSASQDVRVLPSVSIIVPAHNEEKTISRCLDALLEIEYPRKEIVVIDDGSEDRTYEIALGYQRHGVKVFHRPKAGGKSMALNTGILFSSGEVIVTCDADSLISRKAIRNIVKRFADVRVNAVAGNVKVLNADRLLTRCQALEYIVNENIYRRVFDVFGVVPVVPGPLAAFRRSSLEEIGFYDRDTLTEDFDVTIQILKTGKAVQVMSDAFVYTEAPATWRDFYRQRLRWNRGTFQNIIKHRNVFWNPRFGFLYSLTFPYVLLSMLFIPMASVVSIAAMIVATMTGYLGPMLLVTVGFILLQTTYSLLAVLMDDEDPRLVALSPLFVVGFKDIRNFIKLKSFIDIITKRQMQWGQIRRVGTSAESPESVRDL